MMGIQPQILRRLPLVLVATFAVVGTPVVVVSLLRASGTVTSMVPLIAVGVVLSVGASYLGSMVWAMRKRSGDMLFADLMLWGWLRRWLLERQLANAVRLLGLRESRGDAGVELSSSRRVRLLKQLATGLEVRYPDFHGHSRRVARHAAALAKRMGLEPDEVARIRTAATVHDVGKVDVPSAIINKPGKLTDDEFAAVKQHAEIGARMVTGLGDEALTRMVRHHHERLDGSGYPDGLTGAQIPLGARIIAVADTFDALTSTRPYRPARRHKDALSVLAAGSGTQLDAEAVRAFRGYYSGHRPVALWALLLHGSRQFLASFAAQVKLAGAVAAATLATVTAGHIASHPPPGDARVAESAGAAAGVHPGGGPSAGDRQLSAGSKKGAKDNSGSEALEEGGLATDPSDAPQAEHGDTTSPNDSGPISGGGGSTPGGGKESESTSSDPGSTGTTGSDAKNTASQVVSSVTAPISPSVDSVVEKVEPTLPVKVSGP